MHDVKIRLVRYSRSVLAHSLFKTLTLEIFYL